MRLMADRTLSVGIAPASVRCNPKSEPLDRQNRQYGKRDSAFHSLLRRGFNFCGVNDCHSVKGEPACQLFDTLTVR